MLTNAYCRLYPRPEINFWGEPLEMAMNVPPTMNVTPLTCGHEHGQFYKLSVLSHGGDPSQGQELKTSLGDVKLCL